jgi:formiminotetrahydrofolate cyclodeaminase
VTTGPNVALADRSLYELLDQVAGAHPAPGGGYAAAVACALGAGLVEMAAALSIGRGAGHGRDARMVRARAEAADLRARLLALAERDLEAYAPVLAALRLPCDSPDREPQLDQALSSAAEVPLATAAAGAEAAELAAEACQAGNVHLRGDAITAALLSEAGCRAAAALVQINLAHAPGDPRARRAGELAAQAWNARQEALR